MRICFILLLLLSSCYTTPASQYYRRSEYHLEQIGGLMVTTSPDFRNEGISRMYNTVAVRQSWLIQNKSEKLATIQLTKATVSFYDKVLPLNCLENNSSAELNLNLKGKIVIDCYVELRKNERSKSDILLVLSLPTSEGIITSRKLIRAEDFQ